MIFEVKNDEAILLKDYLKDELKLSRQVVKLLKYEGGITVNGASVDVRKVLKAKDKVRLTFPKEKRAANLTPQPIPINIVYEDDFYLVVNKQAGLAVMPSQVHKDQTLANGLIYYYESRGDAYTAHIVTRLDRDTSGLVLVAKTKWAHSALRDEKIERTYLAKVEGYMNETRGEINLPIGRKEGSIIEREVTENGKEAITRYEVISAHEQESFLKLKLVTGRTHQIRVHFSHIGHPLCGDDLYGGSRKRIMRQALHCHQLIFIHPFTKKHLTFESGWPSSLS